MILFYRLFLLPLLFLSAPYYLYRKVRRGDWQLAWQQRFGLFPKLPNTTKRRIWIQAVSVGEILAIESILKQLKQMTNLEIVLTTTTVTGYKEARKRYQDSLLSLGLFPLDFWPCSATAWSRIQPDAILLVESELWPEHLYQASRRKVPVFLINARLSDQSYRRLKYLTPLARYQIKKIDTLYCATQLDFDRFTQLAANPEKKIGNIKLDVHFDPPVSPEEKRRSLIEMGFATPKSQETPPFILVGASTWDGEEHYLLEAQRACLAAGIACHLILVPRHTERRTSLLRSLAAQELPWSSASGACSPKSDPQTETHQAIHLSDTTGHLAHILRLADLAFIGKSLPPNKGGQTPIEAAAQGIPLIFGPNMSNFTSIATRLVSVGAAREVKDAEELKSVILQLAQNASARNTMSVAGLQWHQSNKGISATIASDIEKRLTDEEASLA